MLNETINTLINAKAEVFFPSVIFVFISFLLSNLLFSWMVYSSKTNWGKVWTVWILTAILVGIFVAFIVASPEQTLNFINWVKNFLGI